MAKIQHTIQLSEVVTELLKKEVKKTGKSKQSIIDVRLLKSYGK